MLSDLPVPSDPRVLVDYRNADDAGVFVVGDVALVQTVDFFTPIVDDPFAYGRIAAANAVSDVYAMGGRPITALAIAAFPAKDFAADVVKAIFAGGLSILRECGVALVEEIAHGNGVVAGDPVRERRLEARDVHVAAA